MPLNRITTSLFVGLCTVDLVQRVRELPAAGQKAQSSSVSMAAGGPVTNAAVAAAALGGSPTLVTVLGTHPLAEMAHSDLEACGVTVIDVLPDWPAPPPISAVAVREHDGERSIVSRNAAAVGATAQLSPSRWQELLEPAGALLLDGHHPQLALGAAQRARACTTPTLLDAGTWKPVMRELITHMDICACSTSFCLPAHPDPVQTERVLHGLAVPVVTRTHGSGTVRWSVRSASGTPAAGEVPVTPVIARDTLGAGDVWHGCLTHDVAGLARVPGADELPELLQRANDAAGVRVQHEGPRAWVEPLARSLGQSRAR